MNLYDLNLSQSERIGELRNLLREADDKIENLEKGIFSSESISKRISEHEIFKELEEKHLALQEDFKKLAKEKGDLEFDVRFANRKIKSFSIQMENLTPRKPKSRPEPSLKRVFFLF